MSDYPRICPNVDRQINDYSSSSSEDEPRTMGDESFEDWTETMGGLNDRGSAAEQDSRIPVLRSRWVYENWMERLDGTNTGDDLHARMGVPQIRSSRIPIPVPSTGFSRPSRIPVPTGQARNYSGCQCCFQRNSVTPRSACQPSRIPVPVARNLRIDTNNCICLCHNN
jgi:hypothetical protein